MMMMMLTTLFTTTLALLQSTPTHSTPPPPLSESTSYDHLFDSITKDLKITHILEPSRFNYSASGGPTNLRGCAASRLIVPGEVIVSVPLDSMVGRNFVYADPLLSELFLVPTCVVSDVKCYQRIIKLNRISDRDKIIAFMLYKYKLMQDKVTASAMSPSSSSSSSSVAGEVKEEEEFHLNTYLKLLFETTDTSSFPQFNSPGLLHADIWKRTQNYLYNNHKSYAATIENFLIPLNPETFGKPYNTSSEVWYFSLDYWVKANVLFGSRNWGIEIEEFNDTVLDGGGNTCTSDNECNKENEDEDKDEDKSHSFLAPVADLLNYGSSHCTSADYNPSSRAFEITSNCYIPAGSEVTFFYGDGCRDYMKVNYGFGEGVRGCNGDEEDEE